jgi:hypothetical protein
MVRGVPSTRVYQTLAKYISRLGYDNAGRVWSIICPQFGLRTDVANFNMEVTVTGKKFISIPLVLCVHNCYDNPLIIS